MRNFFLAALLLMVVPAQAQDGSAMAFLQQIYGQYEKSEDGVDFRSEAKALRYFTPTVARLIEADSAEAARNKEVGRLDFDPFIAGQFWAPTKVAIGVEPGPTADRALGTARYTFKGAKAQTVIKLDLVRIPAGWRIADMRWEGLPDTLVKILSAKQ